VDIKLKTAVAVAALLGAVTVGQFVVISQLHVQLNAQQGERSDRQRVTQYEAKGLKTMFSGATPNPKLMP